MRLAMSFWILAVVFDGVCTGGFLPSEEILLALDNVSLLRFSRLIVSS